MVRVWRLERQSSDWKSDIIALILFSNMAPRVGYDPTTFGLTDQRYYQLSYRGMHTYRDKIFFARRRTRTSYQSSCIFGASIQIQTGIVCLEGRNASRYTILAYGTPPEIRTQTVYILSVVPLPLG